MDQDRELRVGSGWKHALDDLASDLGGDDVISDTVSDFLGVKSARQEAKQVMVDSVKIFTMLTRVTETRASDLRKLTGSVEAGWCEWI